MLQVDNRTPFAAALAVFPDRHGVETAVLCLKAAFEFGEHGLVPAARPVPLLPGDVFAGDPQTTGLRAAGELALPRPGTDVTVLGHAVAAHEGTRGMSVALQAGPVTSQLLVQGERRWQRQGLAWRAGEPAPFERVPLRWELAFGGVERVPAGEEAKVFEARNPVGRGLVGSRDADFHLHPLPQIEHPGSRLEEPGQRCEPAGWAPVPPFWAPRRDWAGTYDAAWQKKRAPFLPLDFDERFFNTMPPAMVAPGRLKAGDAVRLAGCRPRGELLAFELPDSEPLLRWRFRGAEVDGGATLAALIIEPDRPRVQLLWQAAFAVDKHLLKLEQVRVDCPAWPQDAYLGAQLRRAA